MGHSHGSPDPLAVPSPPPGLRHLLVGAVAVFVVLTVGGLIALWPSHVVRSRPRSLGPPVELVNATVQRVTQGSCEGAPAEFASHCVQAHVRITNGPDKGRREHFEVGESADQPTLNPGDRIVLGRSVEPTTNQVSYYFSDFQRRSPLLLLTLFFSALVIGLARWKGLAALVGLLISLLILVRFVLPSILDGNSPVAVAIVGSAAMMFAVIYLAHGIDLRSTTALLGTGVSLVLTGLFAWIFVDLTQLSGLASEEVTYLRATLGGVSPQGLLLGGIIIGALGVLNDVTVTQASAVWEIHGADPAASARSVYRSAMRVGRDHIAATVDTIVLAYAGAALPLLVLFTVTGRRFTDVITGELVAEELVRSLVGSIGLVLSVPITTGLGVFLVTRLRADGAGRRDN